MSHSRFLLLSALIAVFLAGFALPSHSEADATSEEESGGGVFNWLSQMKVKMMAQQYGLDTGTTEKLMAILKQEAADKKKTNLEIKSLMTEMEASLTGAPTDQDLMTKMNAIQEKKVELANIENKTWNNVVELLGAKKASEWILARRGVVERMSGAVKRANQPQSGSDTGTPVKPVGAPRRGNW